jgi:hypothetical protein
MKRTLILLLLSIAPTLWAQNKVDRQVIHRIKQEVFDHTEVMDHLFHLVEVHGPRITGSPGFNGSAKWAASRLKDWGAENVKLEKWGPFGQGWSRSYFSAHLVEPQYEMLIGVPLGWTPSTPGVVSGQPILAPFERQSTPKRFQRAVDEFIEEYKGKLGGQIILITDLKDVGVQSEAALKRLSGDDLANRAKAPEPRVPIDFMDPDLEIPENDRKRYRMFSQAPMWWLRRWSAEMRKIQGKLNEFLTSEGVRLVIHPASRGDGGTVFPPRSGDRRVNHPIPPPSIALTPEHYNRVYRLVEKKVPMKIEVEVKTAFHRDSLDSINVIGELPGGAKKDEIIMIGAHLDSTAAALGATDNGAGCAVMLEVMRVLSKLDLKLDRTVRIALWGGEEQGLLGSHAYVKEHFADPTTMNLTAEHANLTGYFNVDNGTGKIRGVYLQENDMVRPIFRSWLEPFSDMGATTLSIRNTGGTDHLSFDEIGLPGFQFIQDPVEYETRSHHSNMDAYDRVQPGDLMQAVAIVASFVYHAANREKKLPRKPLPEPRPAVPE